MFRCRHCYSVENDAHNTLTRHNNEICFENCSAAFLYSVLAMLLSTNSFDHRSLHVNFETRANTAFRLASRKGKRLGVAPGGLFFLENFTSWITKWEISKGDWIAKFAKCRFVQSPTIFSWIVGDWLDKSEFVEEIFNIPCPKSQSWNFLNKFLQVFLRLARKLFKIWG